MHAAPQQKSHTAFLLNTEYDQRDLGLWVYAQGPSLGKHASRGEACCYATAGFSLLRVLLLVGFLLKGVRLVNLLRKGCMLLRSRKAIQLFF